MGDFLRRHARTPLVEDFHVCGIPCRVLTNSESILRAARESFASTAAGLCEPRFTLRFWADADCRSSRPWPKPHLRGLEHLVYAGFDVGSFGAVDLLSRRIVGRFSPEMAADTSYWNRTIFPMLMSVIGASVGITELHCACVESAGKGILLAGPSGAGKSTLALALSTLGLGLLSDDRTFCSSTAGKLQAWSPLTELKLRDQATKWFLDLRGAVSRNGDEVRFAPEDLLRLRRARECEPRWIVFLQPQKSAGFRLREISREEATERLGADLMAESADTARGQAAVISELAKIPCSVLEYSDDPWAVAQQLVSVFTGFKPDEGFAQSGSQPRIIDGEVDDEIVSTRAVETATPNRHSTESHRQTDPLGRFRTTDSVTDLPVMGRVIRLETDSPALSRRIEELFSVYPPGNSASPDFRWRIVHQPSRSISRDSFRRRAFSDAGLRFVQIGQRTFSIVDLESRVAFASVTEEMINDDLRFTVSFLDSLFCITASSLGLVALFSNCVARDGKGALILGPPGSGKTTASYAAARMGMHLLADEGVFLDVSGGEVRAWGGFWPIVFRQEAGRFLPELQGRARQFHYGELAYYHLDQTSFQTSQAFAIEPVCSIFLDRRESSTVRVRKLSHAELQERLTRSLLFEEEDRFHRQQETALNAVAALPAYELRYGPDPADAARVIQELLGRHSSVQRGHPLRPADLPEHSGIAR